MGIFWALFEVVTTPLAVVADVVTIGNSEESKSFTRKKMEAIDEEIKDTFS